MLLTFLTILATILQIISCECRQSYMTKCDTVADIRQPHQNRDTWTELIVGPNRFNEGEMLPLDLKNLSYYLPNFRQLSTLIIIHQINSLTSHYGSDDCEFPGSKLKFVNLYDNTLGHLDRYIKFPLYKLETLSLVNNKITSIKRGTFRFHEIKNFDASNNSIAVIEQYALPSTSVTEVIRLRNNRVATIEPGSFPPSLIILNLDNNQLDYVSREVLLGLVNLEEFTVSHNKLEYLPYLSHMSKLHLLDVSHNFITNIDNQQLKLANVLDLSHNLINDPNVLQFIDIKINNSWPKISLAFNRLKTLNLTGISLPRSRLIVYGNPWDCEKWEKLKKQLDVHETECGIKYFYSGTTPYCINYQWRPGYTSTEIKEDTDRFYDSILSNMRLVGCDLKPRIYNMFPHCSSKNYD